MSGNSSESPSSRSVAKIPFPSPRSETREWLRTLNSEESKTTTKLLRVVAIIATLTLTLSAQPLGPSSPKAFTWSAASGGNGHIYEPVGVGPTGVTWREAHDASLAAGGHLATITGAAENLFVFNLVNSTAAYWVPGTGSGPWLGGFQVLGSSEPAGGWRWMTSEPFAAYTHWGPTEPSNGVGSPHGLAESRLHFHSNDIASSFPLSVGFSTWNDLPPTLVTQAYVVEYDPSLSCPCTPTGLAATNTGPNNLCAGFSLCATSNSSGAVRLQLFNLPAGTSHGKVLLSMTPMPVGLVGTGPVFGLNFDQLLGSVLFLPFGVGDPLSWLVSEPGLFPQSPYLFPSGTMTLVSGTTWDVVAVAVVGVGPTPGLNYSNFIQRTW